MLKVIPSSIIFWIIIIKSATLKYALIFKYLWNILAIKKQNKFTYAQNFKQKKE